MITLNQLPKTPSGLDSDENYLNINGTAVVYKYNAANMGNALVFSDSNVTKNENSITFDISFEEGTLYWFAVA